MNIPAKDFILAPCWNCIFFRSFAPKQLYIHNLVPIAETTHYVCARNGHAIVGTSIHDGQWVELTYFGEDVIRRCEHRIPHKSK